MPASEVFDWTCSATGPTRGARTFSCSHVFPDPVAPVIQIDGRHFRAPHIIAATIHPAKSVAETGRFQRRPRQTSTRRWASEAEIGDACVTPIALAAG